MVGSSVVIALGYSPESCRFNIYGLRLLIRRLQFQYLWLEGTYQKVGGSKVVALGYSPLGWEFSSYGLRLLIRRLRA